MLKPTHLKQTQMTRRKFSKKERRLRRFAKEKRKVYRDRYLRKQVSVLNPEPLEKSFGNFLRKRIRET